MGETHEALDMPSLGQATSERQEGGSGCQGPGWREGGWGVTANGNGVSFCGDGMAFGPQTGNPVKAMMTPCLTQ